MAQLRDQAAAAAVAFRIRRTADRDAQLRGDRSVAGAVRTQLQQGQHLTHGCRNWKPVHHVETGPAVAAQHLF